MTLKIRLRQQGRRNNLVYRLVLTDIRNPRDGKYVENLGWYHPQAEEDKQASLNAERIAHWLDQGAQPSDKAESLIRNKTPAIMQKWQGKKLAKREKLRIKKKERRAKAKAKKSEEASQPTD